MGARHLGGAVKAPHAMGGPHMLSMGTVPGGTVPGVNECRAAVLREAEHEPVLAPMFAAAARLEIKKIR